MADESGPGIEEMGLSTQDLSTSETQTPRQPQFIRQFSKEHSAEERARWARDIRSTRGEYFDRKRQQTERQSQLQVESTQRSSEAEQHLSKLQELERRIEELSDSKFGKAWNYFTIRSLRSQAESVRSEFDQSSFDQNAEELDAVSGELIKPGVPPEFEDARRLINNFYSYKKQEWAQAPYTKEDVKRYFSENNLASLSMEDFLLLMRRFPNEIVSHVTRQGIVDKADSDYTHGMNEYTNGFMGMLQNGRLRPGLGIFIQEGLKRGTQMDLWFSAMKSREDALESLEVMLNPASRLESGSFQDFGSLHFATEIVADHLYGSERGNEIFFVFPSAMIASQYNFMGADFHDAIPSPGNDVWVFTEDQRGIDLNAGIVFIPLDARVDPKTGSRYELDENGHPAVNQGYIDKIREVVEMEGFDQVVDQVASLTNQARTILNDQISHQLRAEGFRNTGSESMEERRKRKRLTELESQFGPEMEARLVISLQPLRQMLSERFSISDPRLLNLLLDAGALTFLHGQRLDERRGLKDAFGQPVNLNEASQQALASKGILYVEPKNTVSSREYWEGYMSQPGIKKPNKIVYYQGENPTAALVKWRKENGLENTVDDRYLGFSENIPDKSNPTIRAGSDRFRSIMLDLIDERFPAVKKSRSRKKAA